MSTRSWVLAAAIFFIGGMAGCKKEVITGKREARGVWMSRFEYADTQTLGRPDLAMERIRHVFTKARAAKLNMVFFQVRGNGDAYYKSSLEPWAMPLTGTLGMDPGWDPLQFAIGEAHRLGLELHAWINTFPAWRGKEPPPISDPPSPYLSHPEWLVCDSAGSPMPLTEHYVNLSPGVPSAQQHIRSVVMEIVEKYDVDGIHFDYIRYPEGAPTLGYSHDSISVARFQSTEGNPYRLSWDDWQREQLNQFVFDAYNDITAGKPWVKVSSAVIGKYSGPGWTAYDAVYQDPRRWMELGKMDFIVPMVYWERAHQTHPFVPLVHEWADRVAFDRQVLPGLSVALERRYGWSEISAQIEEVRKEGLPGVVFFASGSLEDSWETLGISEFPYWSVVPEMPWKEGTIPAPPVRVRGEAKNAGILLQWEPEAEDTTLSYIVYRFKSLAMERGDVRNIVTVTPRNAREFFDADPGKGSVVFDYTERKEATLFYYGISSINRLGQESELSEPVRITAAHYASR